MFDLLSIGSVRAGKILTREVQKEMNTKSIRNNEPSENCLLRKTAHSVRRRKLWQESYPFSALKSLGALEFWLCLCLNPIIELNHTDKICWTQNELGSENKTMKQRKISGVLLDYTCRARWPEGQLCSKKEKIGDDYAIIQSCNLDVNICNHLLSSPKPNPKLWKHLYKNTKKNSKLNLL